MHLKYSETSGIFRLYDSEKSSFENKDDYNGVASISWLNDDEVFLYGSVVNDGKGSVGFILILDYLINRNVKKVLMSRTLKRNAPFGKKIRQYEHEALWEIDLSDPKTKEKIRKLRGKI